MSESTPVSTFTSTMCLIVSQFESILFQVGDPCASIGMTVNEDNIRDVLRNEHLKKKEKKRKALGEKRTHQ
jgi:hypothetical protein